MIDDHLYHLGWPRLSALVNNRTRSTAVKVALQLGVGVTISIFIARATIASSRREMAGHSPGAEPVGPDAGWSGAGCALRGWGGHSRGGGACRSGADGRHGAQCRR